MSTLTEFLLARIGEDEVEVQEMVVREFDDGGWTDAHGARVLAECEAKRRIVARESYDRPKMNAPPYNGPLNDPDIGGRHPQLVAYIEEHGERITDTAIVRILALSYADHADYREEWRP